MDAAEQAASFDLTVYFFYLLHSAKLMPAACRTVPRLRNPVCGRGRMQVTVIVSATGLTIGDSGSGESAMVTRPVI